MDKFTILTLLLVIMPVVADEEWIERSDYMNHRNKRQAAASGNHEVNLGPANGYPMRAVTIMHEPFTSWNNDVKAFSGLVPDLFNIIAYRENIKFTMYEVKDGKFGAKKSDGSWSGMIGDVLDRQQATQGKTEDELKNINVGADIAGAALTMTSLRELHIDFINPFKHTGIVMTVKKINKEEFLPVNFRVTDPLSAEVWVICTAAIVLVALVMFAINQLDPYEWSGRYKLGRASELHAETFNLSGSLWFAFTTLQWQGYERAPRSVAGRILSVFWFTFITITLLTYTASLVNWLFRASTVHGKDYTSAPIPDLEHLVMSNRYKYGCVRGGSTYRYLTQNKGDIFSRINTYFKGEGKENLVNSTKQGFEKVRTEENYVFIGEELSALHEINKRPCDIAISGNTFAPRAYAMAYRSNLNRTIVDRLHKAILQMQEEGDLDALQKKWFVDKGECWNVSRVEKMTSQQTALALNNSPKKITLKEYSGPLVLIIVGIIVSVIAAVAETMYFKYKGRYQPGNRPGATQLKLEEDGQM